MSKSGFEVLSSFTSLQEALGRIARPHHSCCMPARSGVDAVINSIATCLGVRSAERRAWSAEHKARSAACNVWHGLCFRVCAHVRVCPFVCATAHFCIYEV